MSFDDDLFDDEFEDEAQTPDIEEPEFEEVFSSDNSLLAGPKQRTGAERISKPFLGKLAKARLIAARAGQLSLGARPMIPKERLKSGEFELIAQQEFDEKVIPIKIVRRFFDGSFEVWPITDFKYFVKD